MKYKAFDARQSPFPTTKEKNSVFFNSIGTPKELAKKFVQVLWRNWNRAFGKRFCARCCFLSRGNGSRMKYTASFSSFDESGSDEFSSIRCNCSANWASFAILFSRIRRASRLRRFCHRRLAVSARTFFAANCPGPFRISSPTRLSEALTKSSWFGRHILSFFHPRVSSMD